MGVSKAIVSVYETKRFSWDTDEVSSASTRNVCPYLILLDTAPVACPCHRLRPNFRLTDTTYMTILTLVAYDT
jgi:hypothetical protein